MVEGLDVRAGLRRLDTVIAGISYLPLLRRDDTRFLRPRTYRSEMARRKAWRLVVSLPYPMRRVDCLVLSHNERVPKSLECLCLCLIRPEDGMRGI